jgi:hypothetical protein
MPYEKVSPFFVIVWAGGLAVTFDERQPRFTKSSQWIWLPIADGSERRKARSGPNPILTQNLPGWVLQFQR